MKKILTLCLLIFSFSCSHLDTCLNGCTYTYDRKVANQVCIDNLWTQYQDNKITYEYYKEQKESCYYYVEEEVIDTYCQTTCYSEDYSRRNSCENSGGTYDVWGDCNYGDDS